MKRVSVDIGGTFTDCFLTWDGKKYGGKALTTHHNLAIGFNNALMDAAEDAEIASTNFISQLESIRYATTLGTNALIEHHGPRIGLLITSGFEGTVPLSKGSGYGAGLSDAEQMNLAGGDRPEPLVPPTLIAGVNERLDSEGEIVIPLNEDHLRKQIRALVDQGAQAFVVSLVNAVVNPEHEYRVEEIILEEFPSHMLGAIPVTLSHLVSGRKGEYARTTTAIINAYLHSVMYHGLSTMEQHLRDQNYNRPMMLVHNSGGMAQLNSTSAVQTIHSGPIAGINAAEHLSNETKFDKMICADMGGTSFDISLVVGSDKKFYDFHPVIDRWLCTVPMVHLKTIGAGGGSIARYDTMYKAVAVGPESAGSEPGPACYNRGGLHPTVTDADLALGYLDPKNYAGGKIKLNKRRAEHAILDEVADGMNLSLEKAALAIKTKVDTDMANGIARELRSKGFEPPEFTLLAYGGNGPLHSCGIADATGINKIFIPPFSSVFSALGAGNIDQVHIHESSKVIWIYDAVHRELMDDFDELNEMIEALEGKGREDLLRQGETIDSVDHRLEFDMRYGNQMAQTSVVVKFNKFETVTDVIKTIAEFSSDYQKRFGEGSAQPQAGVVITAVRVVTFVNNDRINFDDLKFPTKTNSDLPEPIAVRNCYFTAKPEGIETPVYQFEDLKFANEIIGPAVVVSKSTTSLVEPEWRYVMGGESAAWMTRIETNAE